TELVLHAKSARPLPERRSGPGGPLRDVTGTTGVRTRDGPGCTTGSICVGAALPGAAADDDPGGHPGVDVLDDLEVLPGLRGGLNRVAVCAGADDANVASARRGGAVDQRKAGVGKPGNLVEARVSLR